MRYAIISDIHANLEAFTAVLEKIDTLGVDDIVCLGDVVGYNTNPNECIDLIKERKIRCIMGNHDVRAAGLGDPADFNPHAAIAIYWTKEELTKENVEFLAALPRKLLVDNTFLAVHGWINDTDSYIFGARDALENFKLLQELGRVNLCFFGHTHVGLAYIYQNGSVTFNGETVIKIKDNAYYMINPGGVGQPRDNDVRASFLVYDSAKSTVKYHKVRYDVQTTVKKIIKADLPRRLAERLKQGC